MRSRNLETFFVAAISGITFVIFFAFLSSNGLILGNDPAVHLERAKLYLQDGKIADLPWYPPLYHIVLAAFLVFTGSVNVEQSLFLMKALTALIDVLLLLCVYFAVYP